MATPDATAELTGRISELLLSTDFQAALLSGAVLLVLGLIARVFNPRPRVVWGNTHRFVFGLRPPPGQQTGVSVHTSTIVLQNWGTAPATDIEIHLTAVPGHFQLWPPLKHSTDNDPTRDFIISVPNLGMREHFSVELMGVDQPIPDVIKVRTPRGDCQQVSVAPSRQFTRPIRWALTGLLLVGAFEALKLVLGAVLKIAAHW